MSTERAKAMAIQAQAPLEQEVPATALIQVIERAALNPNIDVEKMERLLAMQERIMARSAEQQFNEAMTAAQSDMGRISADAVNPQTKSRYASYAALDKVLRPIYTSHGFALSFDSAEGAPDLCVRVLCHVTHSAGHGRRYQVDMPADGKGAKGGEVMTRTHAVGAAMTYGMRYLLKMIFNVAIGDDDDDGNGASVATVSSFITSDQAMELEHLLKDTGANREMFFKWLNVEHLLEIPTKHLARAKEALEAKKAQKP